MRIRIVIPVRYLLLDTDVEFDFDGFTLTNNQDKKLDLIANELFASEIGLLNSRTILENPILYFDGESENLPLIEECQTLVEIGDYVTLVLPRLIDCLWFVADNSCFINTEFYESVDEKLVLMKASGYNTTTSTGEYLPTLFSQQQLDLSFRIFSAILSVIDSVDNLPVHVTPSDRSTYSTVNPRSLREYNFNRHTIAINFFSLSRKDSSPVVKITFLIAVLEALFSTKNTKQISRKVPDRASSFIGLDDKHVNWMYETMHKSYGIRSDYIHGNIIISKLGNLIALCEELNQAVRMVLLKAFLEPEVFLPENKEKFGNHFARLVEKFKHIFPPEPEQKCKTEKAID